ASPSLVLRIGTPIPLLVCPSEAALPKPPLDPQWYNIDVGDGIHTYGVDSFMTYPFNGGTQVYYGSQQSKDGVFYKNSKIPIAGITDGTSNTFLVMHRDYYDPVYYALGGGPYLDSVGWWDMYGSCDEDVSSYAPLNYRM